MVFAYLTLTHSDNLLFLCLHPITGVPLNVFNSHWALLLSCRVAPPFLRGWIEKLPQSQPKPLILRPFPRFTSLALSFCILSSSQNGHAASASYFPAHACRPSADSTWRSIWRCCTKNFQWRVSCNQCLWHTCPRRHSFATARSIAKLKPPLCSAENKLPIGIKKFTFDKIQRMGDLCWAGHIYRKFKLNEGTRAFQFCTC